MKGPDVAARTSYQRYSLGMEVGALSEARQGKDHLLLELVPGPP